MGSSKHTIIRSYDKNGLPQGWIKAWKCRNYNSNKLDPLYIDPASGYVFFSLCDVFRYVKTGNFFSCKVRPKKTDFSNISTSNNKKLSLEKRKPGTIIGLTVEESKRLAALCGKAVKKSDVAEGPKTFGDAGSETSTQMEANSENECNQLVTIPGSITNEKQPSIFTGEKSHGTSSIASGVLKDATFVKQENEFGFTEEVNPTLVLDNKVLSNSVNGYECLTIVPVSITDDQYLSSESDEKSCEKLQVASIVLETHELLQSENADLSAAKENLAVELEKKELPNSSNDFSQLDIIPTIVKDENVLSAVLNQKGHRPSESSSPVSKSVELLHPENADLSAGKVKLELDQESKNVPNSENEYKQLAAVTENVADVKLLSFVSGHNSHEAPQVAPAASGNAKILVPEKEDRSIETENLAVLSNVELSQPEKCKRGCPVELKKKKLVQEVVTKLSNEQLQKKMCRKETSEITSAVLESVKLLCPANEDMTLGKMNVELQQDSKDRPTSANDHEKLTMVTEGIADCKSLSAVMEPLQIASEVFGNVKLLQLEKEGLSSELMDSTEKLDNTELSQPKKCRKGPPPQSRKNKLVQEVIMGLDNQQSQTKKRRREPPTLSKKSKPELNVDDKPRQKKTRGRVSLKQVTLTLDGKEEPHTKEPRIRRPQGLDRNKPNIAMPIQEYGYFRGLDDDAPTFFTSPFGNYWLDRCIEFAVKIILDDIQVSEGIIGIQDYFKQHLDSTMSSSMNDQPSVTEKNLSVGKAQGQGQNENEPLAQLELQNDLLWSMRDKRWKTKFLGK